MKLSRRRRSAAPADLTDRVANAGLAVLLVGTLLVVVAALRHDPPPPHTSTVGTAAPGIEETSPSASASAAASPSPSDLGPTPTGLRSALLAGGVDALYRWVGDTACTPGESSGSLAKSTDGETWRDVTPPGPAVGFLSSSSGTSLAATVFDEACAATTVTTDDGGVTWETLDASGALTQVSLGKSDGRWALREGEVVHEVDGTFSATPAKPCTGVDVSGPSLVTAISASSAYVVCQSQNGAGRLLALTRDSGRSWIRAAGKREESGLAGAGVIASLDARDATHAVALIRGSACAAGQIRVSTNGGTGWRALPCVSVDGTLVRNVVDVVLRRDGTLLAVVWTDATLMITSVDGTTWSTV